jgi:hypothetical protein
MPETMWLVIFKNNWGESEGYSEENSLQIDPDFMDISQCFAHIP